MPRGLRSRRRVGRRTEVLVESFHFRIVSCIYSMNCIARGAAAARLVGVH